MKKLLILVSLTLLFSACSSTQPKETTDVTATDEPKEITFEVSDEIESEGDYSGASDAWDAIVSAAQSGDCDTFTSLLTSDVPVTDATCSTVTTLFTEEVLPEIDFDLSKYNADGTEVQLYFVTELESEDKFDISLLTTFVKEDDGVWRAAQKFWYEEEA